MRKLFITLSFFAFMSFGAAIISSCGGDEPDCGFDFVNQRVINLGASGREITGQIDNSTLEITQYTTSPYDGNPIDIADLGIQLNYGLETIVMNEAPPVYFGKQAFACSPPPLANQLEDISIIADQPFNGFAAREELNSIFRFSRNANVLLSAVDPVLMDGSFLFFQLTEAPTTTGDFVFTFILRFQDGTNQEVSTETIRISE